MWWTGVETLTCPTEFVFHFSLYCKFFERIFSGSFGISIQGIKFEGSRIDALPALNNSGSVCLYFLYGDIYVYIRPIYNDYFLAGCHISKTVDILCISVPYVWILKMSFDVGRQCCCPPVQAWATVLHVVYNTDCIVLQHIDCIFYSLLYFCCCHFRTEHDSPGRQRSLRWHGQYHQFDVRHPTQPRTAKLHSLAAQ